MSPSQSTSAVPGPDETFAVDANAESLRYLQSGFETYGDIWSIPPRAAGDSALVGADQPQWVVNDPDAIHHILTKRQPDYGKGIGFERVKMLLGDGLIRGPRRDDGDTPVPSHGGPDGRAKRTRHGSVLECRGVRCLCSGTSQP